MQCNLFTGQNSTDMSVQSEFLAMPWQSRVPYPFSATMSANGLCGMFLLLHCNFTLTEKVPYFLFSRIYLL